MIDIEWIDKKEAMRIVGCTESAVVRWCRQGKVRAKKVKMYKPHVGGRLGWVMSKEDILKRKEIYRDTTRKKRPDYFTEEYVKEQIKNDVTYTELFANEKVGEDTLKRWLTELGLSIQLWNDKIGIEKNIAQKRKEKFVELLRWVDSCDEIPSKKEIRERAKNAYPFRAKDIIGMFETKPYRIEQKEQHYHKGPLKLDSVDLS